MISSFVTALLTLLFHTQNALSISSFYVIPVSLDYLSDVGIGLLIQTVQRFGKEIQNTPH